MTNGERADRLIADVRLIAGEMQAALDAGASNLAARRAQEALELMMKALLAEMGVDYPKTHDPAPALVRAIHGRGVDADASMLDIVTELSAELARIRAPAFYQETEVTSAQARVWVDRVGRALEFGEDLLARLRAGG